MLVTGDADVDVKVLLHLCLWFPHHHHNHTHIDRINCLCLLNTVVVILMNCVHWQQRLNFIQVIVKMKRERKREPQQTKVIREKERESLRIQNSMYKERWRQTDDVVCIHRLRTEWRDREKHRNHQTHHHHNTEYLYAFLYMSGCMYVCMHIKPKHYSLTISRVIQNLSDFSDSLCLIIHRIFFLSFSLFHT